MRQFYVWALILLSSASIIGSCARKRSGSKIKSGGGNDFDSTINFKKVDWIDQAGKANAVLISETFDNLDDPSDLTGHTGFSFGDLHFGDLELNATNLSAKIIEGDTFTEFMNEVKSPQSFLTKIVAVISREEKSYWPNDEFFTLHPELLRGTICIPKNTTVGGSLPTEGRTHAEVSSAINEDRLESLVCGSDSFHLGLGMAIEYGKSIDVELKPNDSGDFGEFGYIPATIEGWNARNSNSSGSIGSVSSADAKKYSDQAQAEDLSAKKAEEAQQKCETAANQAQELLKAQICEQISNEQIKSLSVCRDEQWLTQTGKDLTACLDLHEVTWKDLKTSFSEVVSNIPTVPESTAAEVTLWKDASPAAANVKALLETTVTLADQKLPEAFKNYQRKLGLAQHHALATLMVKIADIVHADKTQEGWLSFLENAPKIKDVIKNSASDPSTVDAFGLNVEIKFAGPLFREGLTLFKEKDPNDANSIVGEINKWEISDLENSPANLKRKALLEKVGNSLKIAASILGCANGTGNADVVARFNEVMIHNLPGFSGTEIGVYDGVTANVTAARGDLRRGGTCN